MHQIGAGLGACVNELLRHFVKGVDNDVAGFAELPLEYQLNRLAEGVQNVKEASKSELYKVEPSDQITFYRRENHAQNFGFVLKLNHRVDDRDNCRFDNLEIRDDQISEAGNRRTDGNNGHR